MQQGFESTLRLPGQHAQSLEQLNTRLSAWIQTLYHQRIHSSTGAMAIDLLASASQGVPRLLNLLARTAWIAAGQAAANTIAAEHVQGALDLVPAARDRLSP